MQHERPTVSRVGGDKLTFKSDIATQLQSGWLVGDERVRAEFHQEAIGLFGPDDSTKSFGCFEQRDLNIR